MESIVGAGREATLPRSLSTAVWVSVEGFPRLTMRRFNYRVSMDFLEPSGGLWVCLLLFQCRVRTLKLGFILPLTLLAFSATAESFDEGMIGNTHNYTNDLGKRAVGNRKAADNLYKQSLADEHNAWSSMIPNVALLVKALTESKDAQKADDQAQELARAALSGMLSGATQGKFGASSVSESDLRGIATQKSPYNAQMKEKLGTYGMKLSADQSTLKTPFGDFSTSADDSEYQKTLSGIAGSLGFKGDAVSKGIQQAIETRQAIAAQAQKSMGSSGLTESGEKAVLPAEPSTEKSTTADNSDAGASRGPAGVGDAGSQSSPAGGGSGQSEPNWEKREQDDWNNRSRVRRQMGMADEAGASPLRAKSEDIFHVINVHYQSMRAAGAFYESNLPPNLPDIN